VLFDPPLGPLLDRLHGASDAQGEAIGAYFAARARERALEEHSAERRIIQLEALVGSTRSEAIHVSVAKNNFRVSAEIDSTATNGANHSGTETLPLSGRRSGEC